jgi:hypothetical protein
LYSAQDWGVADGSLPVTFCDDGALIGDDLFEQGDVAAFRP